MSHACPRDDPDHIWPLGWHLFLQAAGIVILGGVAGFALSEAWKAFAK